MKWILFYALANRGICWFAQNLPFQHIFGFTWLHFSVGSFYSSIFCVFCIPFKLLSGFIFYQTHFRCCYCSCVRYIFFFICGKAHKRQKACCSPLITICDMDTDIKHRTRYQGCVSALCKIAHDSTACSLIDKVNISKCLTLYYVNIHFFFLFFLLKNILSFLFTKHCLLS